MNIRFKNVHTKRYRALAFVLSLTVLLSGLVWYGVAQSNQKAEAVHPSRDVVYIDADFYDYYYDCQSDNTLPLHDGDQKRPYEYFNAAVSKYASNNSSWAYPLYFGGFWEDDKVYEANPRKMAKDYSSGSNESAYLTRFTWRANLALRNSSETYVSADETPQFHTAVQGLVDGSRYVDGNLVPTYGGVNLPYFDDNFLKKYYDKSGNSSNTQVGEYMPIAAIYEDYEYPFKATDDKIVIGNGLSSASPNYSNRKTFVGGFCFDSSVDGVYIDTSSKRMTLSTNEIRDSEGKLGFFPFNQYNTDTDKLNFGFGVRYSFDFTMSENGTIDGESVVDPSEYGTNQDNRAFFTFRGDDDVWVFLDDKLLLDMGGGHKDAEGYIDFANQEVGVLFASSISESNKDSIIGDTGALEIGNRVSDFQTLLGLGSKEEVKSYLADGKHTLTMFYMERGKINSNLFVQFNLPTIPNEHMLTVTDKVSVSGVNAGLQAQTLAIADSDAVRYTISNTGTKKNDVHDTGLSYPTYDHIRRQNGANGTPQTAVLADGDPSGHYESREVLDDGYIYLDYENIQSWIGNRVYAWVWGSSASGQLIKLTGVTLNGRHYYKIPANFNGFKILRMNSSFTNSSTQKYDNGYPYDGNAGHPNYIEQSSVEVSSGVVGHINSGYNEYILGDGGYQKPMTLAQGYTKHNRTESVFVPDVVGEDKKYLEDESISESNNTPVRQTNYELLDPLAQRRVSDAPERWVSYKGSSVAGQTNTNGEFNLMYGQSAVFTGQFGVDSTMYIKQEDALYLPERVGVVKFENTNGTRTLSHYYEVSEPTLEYNNDPDGSNTGPAKRDPSSGTDEFTFANKSNTDDKVNIEAIYTREVKTGSISVEKKLADASKYGATADEFTMQVEITNVFGSAGWDVDDYSNLVISGSTASTGNKVESGGTFKMKAGDTVTISGIPVDTVVTITESGTGKYWTQQPIQNNTNITVTEGADHKVTVTNERLTGKLILSKAFGSNVTDPTDQDQTFDFKVTLQSAYGEEFDWDYWKDLITVDSSQVNLTYVGDPMSDTATFEVTGITANASKTVAGIPYGVKYTVDEVVPNGWTMTKTEIEQGGATDEKNSDVFDHEQEKVIITNEKKVIQTGTLTIRKQLYEEGYEKQYFPVHIRFESSTDLTGANMTYTVDGTGAENPLVLKHDSGNVYDAWVKVSQEHFVTISNIPDGVKFGVSEESVDSGYSNPSDPDLDGLRFYDSVWESSVVSTWYSHSDPLTRGELVTFAVDNAEQIDIHNTIAPAGTLTIEKAFEGAADPDDDAQNFTAKLTLTLPEGYSPGLHKFSVRRLSSSGGSRSQTLGNISGQTGELTISFSKNRPSQISNIPIGTVWKVEETSIPTGWSYVKTEEWDADSPTETPEWKEISSKSDTLEILEYNDGTGPATTSDRRVQITNSKAVAATEAYLTIEKYIDKLYYAENDNPHNFPASIGVGTKSPPEDPHGYLGYTEAEQSFVFKVDKYALNADLGLNPQLAPISTSYVVLKFGKDSTKITPVPDTTGTSYYYTDSTTVKVEPGFIYKVTELGLENGLGWRYDFASSAFATDDGDNIIATFNAAPFTSGANNGIEVKYKNTVKDLANATVTFYNKRNETDDKDIESDMSSIKNTIKVEKS